MGLMTSIRDSIALLTSDNEGFGVNILLESPTGETAEIKGLHSKHHLAVDGNGNRVNSKNAHITFSESVLIAANPVYIIRDAQGNVNLKKHKVTVQDSTGNDCTYVMSQWFPNESTGTIICTLSDFR